MPEDEAFALPEDARPRQGDRARFPPAYSQKTAPKMKPSGWVAIHSILGIEPNAGSAWYVPRGAIFGTRIAATFVPPTSGVSPRRPNGYIED